MLEKSRRARTELDAVDQRIVDALVERADLTNKALASLLGLAESTCAYRVRSLRERGVIRGARVEVDHAALGYPLQAVIHVRLGSHTQAGVDSLFTALGRIPLVQQVFHVAGADDFLVHVAVADAEALRDIVLQHITVHAVVRSTETNLVFERRDGLAPLGR